MIASVVFRQTKHIKNWLAIVSQFKNSVDLICDI